MTLLALVACFSGVLRGGAVIRSPHCSTDRRGGVPGTAMQSGAIVINVLRDRSTIRLSSEANHPAPHSSPAHLCLTVAGSRGETVLLVTRRSLPPNFWLRKKVASIASSTSCSRVVTHSRAYERPRDNSPWHLKYELKHFFPEVEKHFLKLGVCFRYVTHRFPSFEKVFFSNVGIVALLSQQCRFLEPSKELSLVRYESCVATSTVSVRLYCCVAVVMTALASRVRPSCAEWKVALYSYVCVYS